MIKLKRFGIPILILVVTLLSACGRRETAVEIDMAVSEPVVTETNVTEPLEVPHEMSIEGLRTRSYSAANITMLNQVESREGLEAWDFSYESEGYTIYGLIEKPSGAAPDNGWPVIVLAHGYIPPDSYSTINNYRLVTRYYAQGGFIVVKPDYRGHGRSDGRGGGPARTIDYSIDVMNLIAGLDGIPEADTGNVFLYGHSMGGEIGLRILTVNNSLKGASLWAAVTESFPENTLYFVRKRSVDEANRLQELIDDEFTADQYATLTPNSYLDSIKVPMLVHHGTADESVPFEWSIPFRNRLNEAGVEYSFFEYPGENHNISKSFYEVMDRDMEFFRALQRSP